MAQRRKIGGEKERDGGAAAPPVGARLFPRHCERGEAIHCHQACEKMDCFTSLAMTGEIATRLKIVIPREGGGIQYAEASRFNHYRPSAQLRTRRVMTTEYEVAISRRIAPEVCIFVCPLRN